MKSYLCTECSIDFQGEDAARKHIRKTGHGLDDTSPETGEVLMFAPIKMGKRELKALLEKFPPSPTPPGEEPDDDDDDTEEDEDDAGEDEGDMEANPAPGEKARVRPTAQLATVTRSDGVYDAEIRTGKQRGKRVIKLFIFDSQKEGMEACLAGDHFPADEVGAAQAEELFMEFGFPVEVLPPIQRGR
jgi:hypothetical protein